MNYNKVTQAKMAELFKVDRSTIKEVADGDGLSPPYDLAMFAKAYVVKLRVAAAGRQTITEERLDLIQEQARLAHAKADAQEMANDEKSGTLIAWADAAALFAPFGREIRQRLLALGSVIGPRVGKNVSEQRRIKAGVDAETKKALKALNDYQIIADDHSAKIQS